MRAHDGGGWTMLTRQQRRPLLQLSAFGVLPRFLLLLLPLLLLLLLLLLSLLLLLIMLLLLISLLLATSSKITRKSLPRPCLPQGLQLFHVYVLVFSSTDLQRHPRSANASTSPPPHMHAALPPCQHTHHTTPPAMRTSSDSGGKWAFYS